MSFLDALPIIKQYKNQILVSLQQHKVTIIKGPTGCGKSTYIPFILKKYKVAVIEPRRIAVLSLYNTLKPHMDVGYKVRFSSENLNSNVIFMTDGMFINQLIKNGHNQKLDYDFVILDEIHERNLRIDLIMTILKRNNNGPKIVLMSATVNTSQFQRYFIANVVEIKTASFKAEIIYSTKPVENYLISCFLIIRDILSKEREKLKVEKEINDIFESEKSDYNKDVLIFLPGEEDIHELGKILKDIPEIEVCKIFGSLSDIEQKLIFNKTEKLKIVISTNICETSLTIPGIKYVIDTGLHKEKIYSGINYFGIKQIGCDNADQRLGRCNRTDNGICYRLYTKDTYKKMSFSLPEIVKSDISFVLLFLLHYNIDIMTLDFLTYPSRKSMQISLLFLMEINSILIIENSFRITDYGRKLLKYPLDVNHAHFYRCCVNRNVEQLGVIILSFVTQSNINFLNIEFKRKRSDLEELICLFKEYYESDQKDHVCHLKNINRKSMDRCVLIYNQMYKNKDKIDTSKVSDLKNAFKFAFIHNLSEKIGKSTYKNLKMDFYVDLHLTNCYYKKNVASIVYIDVFSIGKNYARIVEKYET